MRILVVDDESEIRRILRLVLENGGYDVVDACDGSSAVDHLKIDKSIDLCIMDVMMPGISGIEATAMIRRFSSVPVLFLTAKSLDSDKASAYANGGDPFCSLMRFTPLSVLALHKAHSTRPTY